MNELRKQVLTYIKENWPKTEKQPCDGVPYKFTSPCVTGLYEEFFYWDNYFINKGLMLNDLFDLAYSNVKNIAHFIDKLGYMPNASYLLNRSQPPIFTLAVWDLYEYSKNVDILTEFMPSILIEYEFWMTKRMTPIGLNSFKNCATQEELTITYRGLSDRVYEFSDDSNKQKEIGDDILAIAESGLDFNMRFKTPNSKIAAHEFAHLDLNCFLFAVEDKIAKMFDILGKKEESNDFVNKREARKCLMQKYFYDEKEKVYLDYNFKTGHHSHIHTAVSLYPHCFGVTNDKESALKIFKMLELPCGVSAGEYRGEDEIYYQWDYPVMWGETSWIVYEALVNCGALTEAERVRNKFLNSVEKVFSETHELWEKYDARNGSIMKIEYDAPPFMGWTAFAYEYFALKDSNN